MVTADFILTPSVVFSENNAGGVGGGVGGLLGRRRAVAAIAGGLKFKEAQTSMLLADSRSDVQVAAAEGSTKKADLRLGAGLFGGGVGAAGGGYGNTNEGKIIAAAFMDNYNGSSAPCAAIRACSATSARWRRKPPPAAAKKAGAVFNEGDVLAPKIANVKLMADASDTAKAVGTLAAHRRARGDRRREGRLHQRAGRHGAGWVKIVLMNKR